MHDITLDPHPSPLLPEAAQRRRFTNGLDAGQRPSASRHDDGLRGPLRLTQQGDAVRLKRGQDNGFHVSIVPDHQTRSSFLDPFKSERPRDIPSRAPRRRIARPMAPSQRTRGLRTAYKERERAFRAARARCRKLPEPRCSGVFLTSAQTVSQSGPSPSRMSPPQFGHSRGDSSPTRQLERLRFGTEITHCRTGTG